MSEFFNTKVYIHQESNHVVHSPIHYDLIANNTNLGNLCFEKLNQANSDLNLFIDTIIQSISQNIEHQMLIKKQFESELEIREQKTKNNLLGAISHDLRTPLATIIGSAETIIDSKASIKSADKKLLLHNILDDAHWLLESVQNILSFMQVDENIKLNRQLESIEELFGGVISHSVGLGKQKIHLELPEENIFYPMDIKLMEKVLINLINNAVKYSPKESAITLRALVKPDKLIFEVSDEGPGIPEHLRDKVFDRFVTAQNKNSGKRKGLKQIIRLVSLNLLLHSYCLFQQLS